MIENRELTMDDYLAMLRRRLKVILIPTLLAPLVGFGVSFFFAPKYTSQTTILVDPQKVSDNYVAPVVTQDLGQRVATLEARATSADRLRPLIEKLNQQGMLKPNVDDNIEAIRAGMQVVPVPPISVTSPNGGGGGKKKSDLPGFLLTFTASSPREAQAVNSGLANIIIDENFKDLEAAAQTNTDFLARQLEDAKRDLDNQAARLAEFQKKYMGQLPGDADNNMKILMGLNSQLDANTQTLNRAQQDKAYTESMLAQQLAAWKSSQNATNPATLQQQLALLQSQLLGLQARYTDDYPDVVKTKRDIAELQKKLDELNKAASNPSPATDDKENLSEPPEIRQLRMQIHQYEQAIGQATRGQQRLQESIKEYQGRVALSPAVQQEYGELTRDSTTAKSFYDNLLAKKSQSEMQTAMAREQQGEQMHVLNPADLPDAPSSPNRLTFAGGGLGAGLGIGLGLALWLEMRDKSVRSEADVLAIMDVPVLSQVPWVGIETPTKNGAGNRGKSRSGDEKATVEV